MGKVLLDYTEKSVIKVYNQVTGELVEFKGLKAVKECFTGLFKDLSDLSGLRRARDPRRGGHRRQGGHGLPRVALPELGVQPRDRHVPLRRRGQDREAERRHHEAGGRGGRAVSAHDVTSRNMPM